jgi:hypothetical protein
MRAARSVAEGTIAGIALNPAEPATSAAHQAAVASGIRVPAARTHRARRPVSSKNTVRSALALEAPPSIVVGVMTAESRPAPMCDAESTDGRDRATAAQVPASGWLALVAR